MKKTIQLKENELDWKTYDNASNKLASQYDDTHDDRTGERARELARMARIRFSQKYPKGARYRKDWKPSDPHFSSYEDYEDCEAEFKKANQEYWDHFNGNYEYKPYKEGGKGWQLKDKNESIVREAVNRTLRKYIR